MGTSGSSKPGLIAYTFSAFVLASITLEFVRGTRAAGSFTALVGRNRRRYGGHIVHAALVLPRARVPGVTRDRSPADRKPLYGSFRFSRKAFGIGDPGWDGAVGDKLTIEFHLVGAKAHRPVR